MKILIPKIESLWDNTLHVFEDKHGIYHNVGNGTIHKTDTGYVVINRIMNYYTSLGRYQPNEGEKKQTSSHMLWVNLDMNYMPVSTHMIDHSIIYEKSIRPVDRQLIIGIEDVRLFKFEDRWWIIGSCGHFERWSKGEFWGQVLVQLSEDTSKIETVVHLNVEGRHHTEKNWLPFIHNEQVHILYSSNPVVILQPNFTTGECEKIYTGEKLNFPALRGGGNPITWGNRYLYTIHEQGILRYTPPLEDKYFYLQRFIEMDKEFKLTRVSPLFVFREEGVEYTCGHCISHGGDTLLIPYSSSGGTDSNLMGVAVSTVEKMLNA